MLEYGAQIGKVFCCVAETSLGTDNHEAGKAWALMKTVCAPSALLAGIYDRNPVDGNG